MIPRVIHYCWFGRNPLPKLAQKCIASWRKFLPEYEIKEWNEDNFDVNMIAYTRDAYEAKKFAFVSDYARFWILYHYGGVYFDTDVEVIKSMDDIIERGPFMGIECAICDGKKLAVAPGLGLADNAGDPIFKVFLDHFCELSFYLPNGEFNKYTMIPMISDVLRDRGLRVTKEIQVVGGIYIYPPEFFNPFDDTTGRLRKTHNTRTIHWYMKSWMPSEKMWVVSIKRITRRVIGDTIMSILKHLIGGK